MAIINFIGEDFIKNNSPLPTNLDSKLIIPHIGFSQDSYIQNILGSKLYHTLQLAYSAQTIDANQTQLISLIKPALAYRAASEALPFIHIQIRNSGTVNLNADNGTVQSSIADMKYLRDILVERAEKYEKEIINYLSFNGNLFPDFVTPDATGLSPSQNTSTTCDLYFRNYGAYNNNNNLGYCRCGNPYCYGCSNY